MSMLSVAARRSAPFVARSSRQLRHMHTPHYDAFAVDTVSRHRLFLSPHPHLCLYSQIKGRRSYTMAPLLRLWQRPSLLSSISCESTQTLLRKIAFSRTSQEASQGREEALLISFSCLLSISSTLLLCIFPGPSAIHNEHSHVSIAR